MNIRIFSSLFLASLVVMSSSAFAAAQLSYEPVVVTVEGTIAIEHHYGAPNFGETPDQDKRENVVILKLDSPVAVAGDSKNSVNKTTYKNVKKIQLVMIKDLGLAKRAGSHMAVTGTLYEGFNAHHYTKVLMMVKSIKSTIK